MWYSSLQIGRANSSARTWHVSRPLRHLRQHPTAPCSGSSNKEAPSSGKEVPVVPHVYCCVVMTASPLLPSAACLPPPVATGAPVAVTDSPALHRRWCWRGGSCWSAAVSSESTVADVRRPVTARVSLELSSHDCTAQTLSCMLLSPELSGLRRL